MCEIDGGYFAIKGFLYQFDKSILEILRNPDKKIYIEHVQDIDFEEYVIQVKHKETASFTNSKIKEPVIQLLRLFKSDNSKKLILYCYFSDKSPKEYKIKNVDELNKIIKYRDKEKNDQINLEFSQELKEKFIRNFTINFSEDYEVQFKMVINKIKEEFNINDYNEALFCHSLIRAKLFNLAIKDISDNRYVTKSEIHKYLNSTKEYVFYSNYKSYLGRDKYIKFIKGKYFTFKSPNINCFERLFIIDCLDFDNITVLQKIVNNISNRYFKLNKSPAPYICFRGIKETLFSELKASLIDDNIIFNDGTCFNGDKFRIDKLLEKANKYNKVVVKLINEIEMDLLMDKTTIKEFYHLFFTRPMDFPTKYQQVKVQIEKCDEVLDMIC